MNIMMTVRSVVSTLLFLVVGWWAFLATASDDEWSIDGISKGSRIILLESLSIAAGDYRVFVQHGAATGNGLYSASPDYNQYHPFCFFEIRSPSDLQQTIFPGEFEIIRVTMQETEFVQAKPVKFASSLQLAGSLSPIAQALILKLRSSTQPSVEQMVCADGFADPIYAKLPTLEQIKKVLGKLATFELAP